MGLISILFGSCSTIPEGAVAVKPFNKEKYLGKWFEIARFDFKFERNMNNTTAQYSINDNGTIKVVNRGYNYEKKEWKEANGIAKFVGDDVVAMVKGFLFRHNKQIPLFLHSPEGFEPIHIPMQSQKKLQQDHFPYGQYC